MNSNAKWTSVCEVIMTDESLSDPQREEERALRTTNIPEKPNTSENQTPLPGTNITADLCDLPPSKKYPKDCVKSLSRS